MATARQRAAARKNARRWRAQQLCQAAGSRARHVRPTRALCSPAPSCNLRFGAGRPYATPRRSDGAAAGVFPQPGSM